MLGSISPVRRYRKMYANPPESACPLGFFHTRGRLEQNGELVPEHPPDRAGPHGIFQPLHTDEHGVPRIMAQ